MRKILFLILVCCICTSLSISLFEITNPKYVICEVIQKKDTAIVIFPKETNHIITDDIKHIIIKKCENKSALEIVNYLCQNWGWDIKTQSNDKYILQHLDEMAGFERDLNVLKEYEQNMKRK